MLFYIKPFHLIIASLLFMSLPVSAQNIQYGVRPFYLIDAMKEGPLKRKLKSCSRNTPHRTSFSIAHRGAPLQFPEHTLQSNKAAALMGAGIFECDVTFTEDKQLVCRHAQNDLQATTNILLTNLQGKCTKSFTPANGTESAVAECRTTDITLEEFKTLRGKMDGVNKNAKDIQSYMTGTPNWRTELYSEAGGTLLTHQESIALFKQFGGKFTPELKAAVVPMPYLGFSQEQYAQALINEYKQAGVSPKDVFPQSFNLNDVIYWIQNDHERMDGSGYPRGLKGDEILLGSRLIAIADVIESMSTHRPYRFVLGIDAALDEIKQYRGTLYDSQAVDACLKLFAEKKFTFF
jgi:glycerophosphoryl diester phosphodiesterase